MPALADNTPCLCARLQVGQTMLQQLLARLRSNIQLPECLRIMGYLRRIAVFTEAELRLQFLTCRWVCSIFVAYYDAHYCAEL